MLTEKSLKAFGQALNSSNLFGFSPFYYEINNSRLKYIRKYYQISLFVAQVTLQFCYLIFLGISLGFYLKHSKSENTHYKSTYADIFWLGLFFGGIWWSAFSILCAWLRRKDIVLYFNSTINYTKKHFVKSAIDSLGDKKLDHLYLLVMYLRFSIATAVTAVVGMATVQPNAKQFIYSTIASAVSHHEFTYLDWLSWVIFMYYKMYGVISAIVLDTIGFLTLHIVFSSWMLNEIKSIGKSSEFRIKMYKNIDILNREYIDAAGFSLALMFITFGIMWTMGIIGALRLYNAVEIFDYFILCTISISGGGILFGVIHFCGNVPERCEALLKSLLNCDTDSMTKLKRKVLVRTVRSLAIFGIRSGPIRLLKHKAVYLYFGGMINCIVTFLVANPHFGK